MVSVPWDLRRAFSTMEEGMRYCEGEFLEVAQRHGLCRPSNSVLTLKDILELHASVVSVSRYPNAALRNAIFCSMSGTSVAHSVPKGLRRCGLASHSALS